MKTLKALVAKYNAASLILRILVGLLVGVVLALVVPGAGWVEEFGNLFVGALKGIAPVLVFVIVASALAQGTSKLDRRFGTVIWLYMLTTFLAAAIAVVTSFLFPQTIVLAEAASRKLVVELHPVDIRAAIFFEKKHTNRSCVSDKVDGCDEKSHIPFNLEAGDKPFEE